MKLNNLPKEFLQAAVVIREIQKEGYEAYFVGGSVRDALLEQPIHDVDIATSAYPEEIKQIFKRTVDIGIEHGTVLVLVDDEQYEITTFRTESAYQDYRRPDEVMFVRSLEEDLKRRDFTMNALAMDDDGKIIDLFDGMNDLENKVIQAVGNPQERFHEDALRMMRGLRFASQLDFSIEPATLQAIEDYHSLLGKISIERVTMEFVKLLLGNNRKAGLVPFVETKCYQYCPGLRNYGEAILRFTDLPSRQITSENQAWVLFLHTLGIEQEDIRPFLKQWKLSNHSIQNIQQLSQGLNKRLKAPWHPLELYHLGIEAALAVEELLVYYHQDGDMTTVKKQFQQLPIYERQQLKISGNDLLAFFSKKPGKWVGELIETLEESVVEKRIVNEKKKLLAYAEKIMTKEYGADGKIF